MLLALARPVPSAETNGLTSKEIADGWISLFDGETTCGWHSPNGSKWTIEKGMLAPQAGKPGLLVSTSKFKACELKLQYIVEIDDAVEGRERDDPAPPLIRFGCDSAGNDVPKKALSFNLRRRPPFLKGGSAAKSEPFNREWIDLAVTLTADGPDRGIKWIWRSKSTQSHVTAGGGDVVPEGHIALFGNGVIFRNIKLKPLGLKPLFNGKDLTGWKAVSGNKAKFTVTDKRELNIKGGPGGLKTEGQRNDFVLQLDCINHGKDIEDGERQLGRKVVTKDKEWFTKTVIAHGNHTAVWVNGYQITDITGKGPVSLQGHGHTTNFSFRNIRIAELTKAEK